MEPLSFEWTALRKVRVPLTAPLTCADLATGDLDRLSFSGAHHSMQIDRARFGIGALNYRQFSDWNPGGPLFPHVLTLSVTDGKTVVARAEVSDYEWRPDYIQRKGKLGDWLEVLERVGYADAESISDVLWIRSKADRPLKVRLSGAVSEKVKATVAPVISLGGVRVDLQAQIPNAWNYPASELKRSFWIASDLRDARITTEDCRFTLEFDLKAGGFREVEMAFTAAERPEDEDRAEILITESYREMRKTTGAIDRWLAEAAIPPSMDEHRLKMYYNAWFQFWYNTEHPEGYWTRPIITPSKSTYGRGVWLWDSAFHIFALMTGGPDAVSLAKDQVRVLVEGSKVVGHLPREVWVGAVNPEIQPPGILTSAALKIYRRTNDRRFLADIYEGLSENNRWYYKHKDSDGNGLCEWAGGDSGWDTSPRWDQGEVDAVDLNCWLCLDQARLSEMAKLLGLKDDSREWAVESKKTAQLIRAYLWDEEAGCYYDRNPKTGKLVRVHTPATFWTLLAEVATKPQAARMVELLKDPRIFGTPYPIPCVGADEPTFEPTNYWRGPTWINLNWVTIIGLERYGYKALAADLRRKTLDLIAMNPVPREYYHPLTGAGLGAENYMWTGALYVVMASGT